MKNTIKTLYDIEAKSLTKYSNKVYKIQCENNDSYGLKYVDKLYNSNLADKVCALSLSDLFVMPIKSNISTQYFQKDNKIYYLSNWIDNDFVDNKDLKIKYYLKQIATLHQKSSYTLNVSSSYFKEMTMKIEEKIEECYQKYENMMFVIERREYKSPFEWYFIEHFKDIIDSLDKSRKHLNKFKELVKNKATIRQVIVHQNFSYDHIFISQNKIIGNDKMKVASPIFDLKQLFDVIEYGSIDLSGLIEEYEKHFKLDDYEIHWLLAELFIVLDLNVSNNDMKNLKELMKIMFRYKSVCEFESKQNV